MIMHIYVKRSYQGRLKREADTLGQQYSPGHTASLIETVTNTYSVSYTGGETDDGTVTLPGDLGDLVPDNVDVPDGMTASFTDTDSDFKRKEAIDSFAVE